MTQLPGDYQQRIAEAKANRLPELDLSADSDDLDSHKLRVFPAELLELTHLASLTLRHHSFTSVPDDIDRLQNLTTLDLSFTNLTAVPDSLSNLSNLTALSLWVEKDSSVGPPSFLSSLERLQVLELVGFSLFEFPTWLTQLPHLTQLNLSDGQISALPDWLPQLRDLTLLWLANNLLPELPPTVAHLTSLERLSLAHNPLTTFPLSILALASLELLVLAKTGLDRVPDTIDRLTRLQHLDLKTNRLRTLPVTITALQSLRTLMLSNNLLTYLPDSIYALQNLTTLDLSNKSYYDTRNTITRISPDILRLPSLTAIELAGNPMEAPPPEIAFKGIDAIREYYRQLEAQGFDYLYEAKLLILGEGGAGKTTLARKLQDPDCGLSTEEDSTRGIDVAHWRFPIHGGRPFQVNIWDFGGQEIYHATHQFFLTKRSLYVLVTDTRKEDTDFNYWLNVIELLTDASPLVIVTNERGDRHKDLNERLLKSQFLNVKNILPANLATNRGLIAVVDEIQHYIARLPHIGTPLPKTWVDVRQALERDPRNHISLDEYLEISRRHGFVEVTASLQLSGYLHDLGVCLHFQDDPLLRKTIILKPKWGTDAVYKVLDNYAVVGARGRFSRGDLSQIWNDAVYADMRDELLQLMIKFRLCYEIPGQRDSFIAPQLLTDNQPEYPWNDKDNLLLRYRYAFMPKGILTQFIVVMQQSAADIKQVWKSGLVIDKTDTIGEIIEYYDKREIRVRLHGRHKKDLLAIIMYELDKIHATYLRLRLDKLIPCNCTSCNGNQDPHFYPFEELRDFVGNGQTLIQCRRKPYSMISVLGLVDDVGGKNALVAEESLSLLTASRQSSSANVVFQAHVQQFIMEGSGQSESIVQTSPEGSSSMTRRSGVGVNVRSAWANGTFYLFSFVVVISGLGVLAQTMSPISLPLILVAGIVFVPLIGALQLRQDDRLSEKSFLQLMALVIKQLPWIGRFAGKGREVK